MSASSDPLEEAFADLDHPELEFTVRAHVAALQAAAKQYGPAYVAAMGLVYISLAPPRETPSEGFSV